MNAFGTEHPYRAHVDLRSHEGKYLGAITVPLYRHHKDSPGFLRLAYFVQGSGGYQWSHEFHTDLYSVGRWTILGEQHDSVLRSARECILVNKGQADLLIKENYAVAYGIDPLDADVREYMLDCARWRS